MLPVVSLYYAAKCCISDTKPTGKLFAVLANGDTTTYFDDIILSQFGPRAIRTSQVNLWRRHQPAFVFGVLCVLGRGAKKQMVRPNAGSHITPMAHEQAA